MFKGLSNIGSLLKTAQQVGGQMHQMSEKLRQRRVTGSAGGGMVEIEVNGLMEVLGCRIDPTLVEQGDRELLEDLVATAVNQAIQAGKQLHAEAMKDLTGGIELPGLHDAMAKFMNPEGEGPGELEDDEEPKNV